VYRDCGVLCSGELDKQRPSSSFFVIIAHIMAAIDTSSFGAMKTLMISIDALLMRTIIYRSIRHVSFDGGATQAIQVYKEFSMECCLICFVQRINSIGIVFLLQAADFKPLRSF
jgi:hypothetical protein